MGSRISITVGASGGSKRRAATHYGTREIEDKLPSVYASSQGSKTQVIAFKFDDLPTTTLTVAMTDTDTTITVVSTKGFKDFGVLQVESDEIVEKAKANGVPVEYVIFEDEGHGFRKKDNQIESNKKILEFLDKYLKKNEE